MPKTKMRMLTRWKRRDKDRAVTLQKRVSHELNPSQLRRSSCRISLRLAGRTVGIVHQALFMRDKMSRLAVQTAAARRASNHSMMHLRNKIRKGKLKGRALFSTKYRQIKLNPMQRSMNLILSLCLKSPVLATCIQRRYPIRVYHSRKPNMAQS